MSLQLTTNGHSDYVISIRREASEPERFAAEELSRYLRLISGASLSVEIQSRWRRVIELRSDLKAKSPDAFAIRTRGSRLILSGTSPRAVLFAVYTFLEECLGCAWLKPGDEHIPDLDEVKIGPLNISQQPSFRDRILIHFPYHRARAIEQMDCAVKRKLNVSFFALNHAMERWNGQQTRERVLPELRKRGLELRMPGHAFFTWLPPERYFAAHPEYFTLKDGQRRADVSVCLSNPTVAREMARNIGTFVTANPEVNVIALWHNDLMGFCECAECRKLLDLDAPSASYMNALELPGHPRIPKLGPSTTTAELMFVNRVAGHIERIHPGVRIETLAYGPNFNPSRRVRPRRNVIVGFALFDKCLAPEHATTPITQGRFHQPAREYLREWKRRAGDIYIYEYYGLFHDFTPLLDVMSKDLKFYRQLRLGGISTEIACWNELHMYAFARLAWNARLSPKQILHDYCAAAYGPVADLLFEHWTRLQRAQLDWNYNMGQVHHKRTKIPHSRWFAARQRTARWKKCEAQCRVILAKAADLLQRSPLRSRNLALATGTAPLARIRQLQARWNEVPTPWWTVPA